MKIKTNDNVKILSGKDKGKTGKVVQVFPNEGKIVVEGLNIIKKHMRAKSRTEKGQILELSAPFFASKAMVICPKCEKTMRVGYKVEAGKKKRNCRHCQQLVD